MSAGKNKTVIAIDGPSAAGKGTVARILAQRLGLKFLDTGAIYRAFALFAREKGAGPEDGEKISALLKEAKISSENTAGGAHKVILNGRDVSALIRTPEVSADASRFSEIAEVREKLGKIQRAFGEKTGAVAEGRDMGTRIFPDADHKFFLTAQADERARRRNAELKNSGTQQTVAQTAADIKSRDLRDMTRGQSPLKPASDAVIIDTTRLTAGEVAEKILSIVGGWKSD